MSKISFISTWKFKPLRVLALAVFASLAATLPFFMTGCEHKEEEDSGPTVVEVDTTHPERKDLTREIAQPGFLIPFEITPIYTKIPGFAEDFQHDLGDRVKKDELLVQLWVPEEVEKLNVKAARIKQAEADVKQANAFEKASEAAVLAAKADVEAKDASVHSAEADVTRWKREVDRADRLFKQGVFDKQTWDEQFRQLKVSEAILDETIAKLATSKARKLQADANLIKAQADIEVSDANLLAARADWKQQKAWLDYREIRAPYDGVISLRNVSKGDFLQPAGSGATSLGGTNKTAEPIFVMLRTEKMRCTIEVPEKDAVLLRNHDRAEIHFQAMPGAPTIGYVERNSGHLDNHSRTLRVEVWLDNPSTPQHPNGLYLPNMYANVIIKAKMPHTWSLPTDVVMNDILADGDKAYVFMMEDGKAEKTFLEVGQPCDEGLPILRKQKAGSNVWQPITGNEVVIVNGKSLLDGQQVQLKKAAAK